jgi:hypothetical protein
MAEVEGIALVAAPHVRIEYVQEGDTWWAYANLRFSASEDTLETLRQRVHDALEEVMGEDVSYTEIVNHFSSPMTR